MVAKDIKTKKDSMIKLNLSITERMSLPSILPKMGSTVEMDLAESLEKRVMPSPVEVKEFEMAFLPDGRYSYNILKAKLREFCFEPYEISLIQHGARMLEEQRLVERHNKDLVKRVLSI